MNIITKKAAISAAIFTSLLTLGAVSMASANEERKFERQNFFSQIEKSIENTNSGVVITLTSENNEVVEKLQSREGKNPKNENVSKEKVNIENGVQITLSGADADTIEKIQTRAAKKGEKMGKRGKGKKGKFFRNVDKSVENIENGVILTLTSEDAEVVEKLQNKKPRAPKNENISREQVNIENGVQITITSTNPKTAKKIQSRAEKKRNR